MNPTQKGDGAVSSFGNALGSERQPEERPETIETYRIGDRSLAEWHGWLTTDQTTGEATGHLETPGSGYGRTSEECAWWAVAAEVGFASQNGGDESPEASLEALMGVAVNNLYDLAAITQEFWEELPSDLQERLGGPEVVQSRTYDGMSRVDRELMMKFSGVSDAGLSQAIENDNLTYGDAAFELTRRLVAKDPRWQ